MPVLALLFSGGLAAMVMLILVVLAVLFQLWWQADERQQMVRQLPGSIDALPFIAIGDGLRMGFPDRGFLGQYALVRGARAGQSIEPGGHGTGCFTDHAARLYRSYELELVAAVIGVALRFGGRSDVVLERMASFMRDLQQARGVARALRRSPVVGLDPGAAADFMTGFIVIFDNTWACGWTIWTDRLARKMLIGRFALQLVGYFWLYRMAKSV